MITRKSTPVHDDSKGIRAARRLPDPTQDRWSTGREMYVCVASVGGRAATRWRARTRTGRGCLDPRAASGPCGPRWARHCGRSCGAGCGRRPRIGPSRGGAHRSPRGPPRDAGGQAASQPRAVASAARVLGRVAGAVHPGPGDRSSRVPRAVTH